VDNSLRPHGAGGRGGGKEEGEGKGGKEGESTSTQSLGCVREDATRVRTDALYLHGRGVSARTHKRVRTDESVSTRTYLPPRRSIGVSARTRAFYPQVTS
jgi:hypothetical protein